MIGVQVGDASASLLHSSVASDGQILHLARHVCHRFDENVQFLVHITLYCKGHVFINHRVIYHLVLKHTLVYLQIMRLQL